MAPRMTISPLTHQPLESGNRMAPLLDLDPDLAELMSPERAGAAQVQLLARVARVPAGALGFGRTEPVSPGHLGLLVVDGLIAAELLTEDVVSLELMGPGDLIRPWQPFGDEALLEADVRWSALSEVRVAVLDQRAAAQLGRYPEVYAALIERLTARAQRLAVTQTICQLNRVDQRVLTMLWHLAGRWGRITSQGTVVPLALSHRMLAQLVGARRPTVSTACGDLARRGELLRRADGTWLLPGEPVGAPAAASRRFVPPRRRVIRPREEFSREVPIAPLAPADLEAV
jgi:CRP/FNR family cyclic AMP-dependent transcriptional regulator